MMGKRIKELLATLLVVAIVAGSFGTEGKAEEMEADGETGSIVVTYDYNWPGTSDSDNKAEQEITGSEFTLKEEPVFEGYEFTGWYGYANNKKEAGSTVSIEGNDFLPPDGGSITAGWCQLISYTVSGTTYTQKVTEPIMVSPVRDGYALKEWMINGSMISPSGSTTLGIKNEANIIKYSGSEEMPLTIQCYWEPSGGELIYIKNNTGKDFTINGVTVPLSENPEPVEIGVVAEKPSSTDDGKYRINLTGGVDTNVSLNEGTADYVVGKIYTLEDGTVQRYITVKYEDSDPSTEFTKTDGDAAEFGYTGPWGKSVSTVSNISDVTALRNGYTFMGWTYTLQRANQPSETVDGNFAIAEDSEYTALICTPVWGGTVTLVPGGTGSSSGSSQVSGKTGTTLSIAKAGELEDSKGEKVFLGWSESQDAATADYTDGTYVVDGDKTLYGVWGTASYTLNWKDRKEDGETLWYQDMAEFGKAIKDYFHADPKKEGYTFLGWNGYEATYDNINYTYDTRDDLTASMPAHDVNMTAQWQINSYEVSYKGNGASVGVPAEKALVLYKDVVTVSSVAPSRTGYTFSGWTDGTSTYQPGETFSMPASDVILTAKWTPKKYNVFYEGNGASANVPDSHKADYDSIVSARGSPAKDGYTFLGWEQVSTGAMINQGGTFVMPDMDEVLKAKWKIAWSKISGKGTYYLVKGQSYCLGSSLSVSGDSNRYSGEVTFYVPSSGYYVFE